MHTERVKRLVGNEIELGMRIPTVESREVTYRSQREQRMLLCGLTDKVLRRICRKQYEHPGSAIGYWPEMCLGHVYIVLELVGSARLTFRCRLYYEFWCTEGCSKSRMWSRTWRGVSKWSRHKDWYIGRLYSDTGMVPGVIGYKMEYRGLPEPPPRG